MITFNEKRAPTSIKYVAESDIIMTNFFQSLQLFWSHSSVFALEKVAWKSKFSELFYLLEALVAAFSEMGAPKSSWARSNNFKCIRDIAILLVALLCFHLRKVV